jgi:hypothetical protein
MTARAEAHKGGLNKKLMLQMSHHVIQQEWMEDY